MPGPVTRSRGRIKQVVLTGTFSLSPFPQRYVNGDFPSGNMTKAATKETLMQLA